MCTKFSIFLSPSSLFKKGQSTVKHIDRYVSTHSLGGPVISLLHTACYISFTYVFFQSKAQLSPLCKPKIIWRQRGEKEGEGDLKRAGKIGHITGGDFSSHSSLSNIDTNLCKPYMPNSGSIFRVRGYSSYVH